MNAFSLGHSARFRVPAAWLAILLLNWFVVGSSHAMATQVQDPPQGVIRSENGDQPWPAQIVDPPPDVPEIPEELGRLKQEGNVKFVFYDSAQFPRKFAGETRFTIQFDSKTTYRWRQVRDPSGKRWLVIRSNFRKPEFQLQHQILVPKYLADENFYNSKLVRHEFDHVRISADPRFRETFTKWLEKELTMIRIELDGPKTESELPGMVNAEMNNRANQLFEKMLDLIQIRYKELDQITRHGNTSLPQEFFGP